MECVERLRNLKLDLSKGDLVSSVLISPILERATNRVARFTTGEHPIVRITLLSCNVMKWMKRIIMIHYQTHFYK